MAMVVVLLVSIVCFACLDARTVITNNNSSLDVTRQERSSQCYGVLGCFDTGGPFFSIYRPVNFLPFVRSAVNTQFYLFTRDNRHNLQNIKALDSKSIQSSNFKPSRPTKIIVHGFIENGKVQWMVDMKDAFLKHGDYNVINVDWGGGSLPPYTQATANTRLVGAEIALLINYLKDHFQAKPEEFHLMGHSLGAHIMGYAGERVQYVGRITGLDPAGPYYENTDPVVRLDPSDALFVDNLHTNGLNLLHLGYGMKEPCGHVDYYPNGGQKQPGCAQGPVTSIIDMGLVEGAKQAVACNHLRAYALFTETINSPCPFEGYRCDSYESFEHGHCIPCKGNQCGYMGFHADKVKPTRGQSHVTYYLDTFDKAPFCGYHHQIQMSFGSGRVERGIIYLKLIGQKGQSEEYPITDDETDITPQTSLTHMALTRDDIGNIRDVQVRWKHNSHWYKPFDWNLLGLRHPSISIPKITVISGEESTKNTFCDTTGALETDKVRLLYAGTSC